MKTNMSIKKKRIVKKNIQKKKKKTIPQHFCVAEDCMLLEGGVLFCFMAQHIKKFQKCLMSETKKIYSQIKE